MSGRWFRFYSAAIRDPKVAVLSDADYRLWTELLAVASDNDGLIPCLEALKSLLKRRSDHLYAGVNRLVKGGLIDQLEDGFEPHNWRKFQYKSDTSTDRVKRFRNGKRNVSETPPDTETDTDITLSKDNGASATSDTSFWSNSKSYLSPHSNNPGAMIGKWCKSHPKDVVAKAITAAQIERAVDPIPYIERVLRGAAKPVATVPL